jgi:predicted small lipoprotein YifL
MTRVRESLHGPARPLPFPVPLAYSGQAFGDLTLRAPRLIRTTVLLALSAGLVTGLSGCGRRGSLEAPGTTATKASTSNAGIIPSGDKPVTEDDKKPENTPGAVIKPPKKSFPLDPIL